MNETETNTTIKIFGPKLTEKQRSALVDLWELWQAHRTRIDERLLEFAQRHVELRRFANQTPSDEERAQQIQRERQQERAIREGEWEPVIKDLEQQGALYAHRGLSFNTWPALITAFRSVMDEIIITEYRGKPDRILSVMEAKAIYLDTLLAALGEGYLRAKQEIIEKQQHEIRELSTPVLQLEDRLLVLPLIGTVDSGRARQITNQVLDAIRTRHARAVVIDLTGVAGPYGDLASHLFRTVESARLMGATVIMTGLSTAATQSLVEAGGDISRFRTESDLQEGVETGRRILATLGGSSS